MNTVKLLHCADIHIGAAESFLGDKAELRRNETLLTFERIVEICRGNNVQILVIAGDLFDSNNIEPRFIEAVLEKIGTIPEIKVVFAAGNHDPLNPMSPFLKYKLPKNLYVLDIKDSVITFDDLKLKVYGRSFETAFLEGENSFSFLPSDNDYINLLVQHGELKSDLNSKYNAITREFILSSKMDYIALGHIHKKTDIGKLGDTYFAYCGCPEGQGFDELDEKGVFLGEIGKNYCNLEFVSTAKRRHIHEKIDISNTTETEIAPKILDTLFRNYGDDFNQNLYKIELIGDISPETNINLTEITARIADRVYFVKVKNNTHLTLNLNTLTEEKSLRGIFVKKMLKKIEMADESQKEKYQNALELGLKAFNTEVKYNED